MIQLYESWNAWNKRDTNDKIYRTLQRWLKTYLQNEGRKAVMKSSSNQKATVKRELHFSTHDKKKQPSSKKLLNDAYSEKYAREGTYYNSIRFL